MNKELILFSTAQGNLLVRLILAHLLADFVLQTKAMAEQKRLLNVYMLLHIAIVATCTWVLSNSLTITLIVATTHLFIDIAKAEGCIKYSNKKAMLFGLDQALHITVLAIVWAFNQHILNDIIKAIALPFTNYKLSVYLAAYIFVIWPSSFIIDFALKSIPQTFKPNKAGDSNTEVSSETDNDNRVNAGKLIGQFERIIILTLVIVSHFDAIGFLITGKSIIRFIQQEEHLRSEYVLAGTMISYTIAILTGVLINSLLAL